MWTVCSGYGWERHTSRATFLPRWSHIRRTCPPNTDFSDSSVTTGALNKYRKSASFPIPGQWLLTCLETRLLPGLPPATQRRGTLRCVVLSCHLQRQTKWHGQDRAQLPSKRRVSSHDILPWKGAWEESANDLCSSFQKLTELILKTVSSLTLAFPAVRLLENFTALMAGSPPLTSSQNVFSQCITVALVRTAAFSLNYSFPSLGFLPMIVIDSNHIASQASLCKDKQDKLSKHLHQFIPWLS